jgi:hypothetical protein
VCVAVSIDGVVDDDDDDDGYRCALAVTRRTPTHTYGGTPLLTTPITHTHTTPPTGGDGPAAPERGRAGELRRSICICDVHISGEIVVLYINDIIYVYTEVACVCVSRVWGGHTCRLVRMCTHGADRAPPSNPPPHPPQPQNERVK